MTTTAATSRSIADLFDHAPAALAVDLHPDYLSAKLGRARARRTACRSIEVQHHHAHIAACLAENGRPLDAAAGARHRARRARLGRRRHDLGRRVPARRLSRTSERLAPCKPVAMPGGAQAVREPWRNLYAHLTAAIGLGRLPRDFCGLELHNVFAGKPRATLDAHDRGRHQRAARLVLRAAVRRRCRRARHLRASGRPMRARRRCGWKRSPTGRPSRGRARLSLRHGSRC